MLVSFEDNSSVDSQRMVTKAGKWQEVSAEFLAEWDVRLGHTTCSYRQFPFWATAYRLQGYRPRFFAISDSERIIAFAAIIEVGIFPFRSAFVDRGPFFFHSEATEQAECIESFIELMRQLRYVFVRFTLGQDNAFTLIKDHPSVRSIEPFPFCRDSKNALVVDVRKDDEKLIAGFNATLRNEIRRASKFQYEIRTGNSDEDFESAWTLFEELASRKGFQLSTKPKAVWREILKLGSPENFARLYLSFYSGHLIAAQIVIRDGDEGELMLAAHGNKSLELRPGPGALLNWTAMLDCRDLGCGYFNLGGPGDPNRKNFVLEFKKKFRPESRTSPEPLCLVLNSTLFEIWVRVILRGWRVYRRRFSK